MPTSYFLPADATGPALDAVRTVGLTYGALGLVLLGMWWVKDRLAVRIVAGAAFLFLVDFALQSATHGTGSSDPFHQLGLGIAVGNAVVAVLYVWLIYRENQEAAA